MTLKTKISLFLAAYLQLIIPAYSDTTVKSFFEITNNSLDKIKIESTDKTMHYRDVGNSLFEITDNYTDANINALQYGNQQLSFRRQTSLIKINMIGKKLGHKFTVYGKYANSNISVASPGGTYFNTYKNNGCNLVSPNPNNYDKSPPNYVISSDNNVKKDCIGSTIEINLSKNNPLSVIGKNRVVYLDIGDLIKSSEYKNAPPDIYIGTSIYTGEVIHNRVGSRYTPRYINDITIQKNPFFEGVSLPVQENNFNIKNIEKNIIGQLTIPYVINGQFTPYNKIKLNISSDNNFSLINKTNSSRIPYSLTTTIGTRQIDLVNNGQLQNSGLIELTNLPKEIYAIQARFDANFSIKNNISITGDYSDNITAIFQISL
ncbi:hypothetical protein [Providencia alcalifaciens]|uniref:hypothetical protein n=1 Tax=Providencia alcalifaciens TaxID=126385 RepID=UPI00044F5810|nr:hypothetical protein [Providencia alcalifaciens]EUD07283.1 hypothetical protein HMPREF1564_3840 [Providencia alcalifaciens R90-1475]